jgi:hypothetical protein
MMHIQRPFRVPVSLPLVAAHHVEVGTICGNLQPRSCEEAVLPLVYWVCASVMASRHKANVLRAYRELVAVVRGMPLAERDAQLQEARAAIRANAGEADPGKASDQLKLLWARLSWLQVVRVLARRAAVTPPLLLAPASPDSGRLGVPANSFVSLGTADHQAAPWGPAARQRHVRGAQRGGGGGRRRAGWHPGGEQQAGHGGRKGLPRKAAAAPVLWAHAEPTGAVLKTRAI